MVDFNKLLNDDASPLPLNPADIFRSLPRADTRFEYLRDVQGDVLKAWHERRTERDIVVKMNTGSGKTLVGLLMLQSLLNSELGPALYLCPTKQLVAQVRDTAAEVGIRVVTDEDSDGVLPHEFLNSEAIYVTTFQKLFNGKSIFGIPGSNRPPVDIGGVLVDDAHRCLSVARETVTVSLESGTTGYKRILTLFRPALLEQSPSKVAEIEQGYPWTTMPLPYWAWQDAQHEVASILASLRDEPSLKFSWDLLKGDLRACHCFISGRRLQITPHLVPIESVPSFAKAKHRFFLSATLIDDSILLKEFGVSKDAASEPIRPPIVGDIGERMILAPSLIDKSLENESPSLCRSIAERGVNVVVLVPSFKAAERWTAAGATLAEDEIGNAVDRLRTTTGNFVVLANRYDGIDLPEAACRVLVLDGVPTGESYYEQHVASVRSDSTLVKGRVAQTIEQGLGRGVRSGKDYCVVLLCGSQLVQFVGVKERLNLFSPETKQQFIIGQEIVKQSKTDSGSAASKLLSLVDTCLKRNAAWKTYHAKKMMGLSPRTPDAAKLDIAESERTASVRFRGGNAMEAGDLIQKELDRQGVLTDSDKGWFLQLVATYVHSADPTRAQELQRRAHEWNPALFRPVAGIRYQRMIAKSGLQAQNALAWVQSHTDPNAIIVSIEALINSLTFGVHHARFESAWAELGTILGFASARPEEEIGKGPDGLWAMPENYYLLAEIKNEVLPDRSEIAQSETEQMSNSANWFAQEYGTDAPVVLMMVHRTEKLANSAYPPSAMVVMTPVKLDALHSRLRAFAAALATKTPEAWTASDIGKLLVAHRLDAGSVRTAYCVPAKR